MPALVMLSPAPVIETPGREVILDVNFVEGMKLHCQLWPGRVCCVLRRGAPRIADGVRYSPRKLGFDLVLLDRNEPVPDLLLEEAGLVYCAADDLQNLHLPDAMRGRIGRLVYTVEQSMKSRLQSAFADSGRSTIRRLNTALWILRRESALRRALKQASGVHFNGPAVQAAYRRLNREMLVYLDNRIRTPMLARSNDQQARADRLRTGAPLRLVHFGALDKDSGALDLLQLAFLLRSRGVDYRLEFFGNGALSERLQAGIEALGLRDMVRMAGPISPDAALFQILRQNGDLFVTPRRLSDPVSSYIEAMGCGLPILGYSNDMWQKLHKKSGAGWTCGRGGVAALTEAVIRLDGNREAVIQASAKALEFARTSTFETVFSQRMAHLWAVARLE